MNNLDFKDSDWLSMELNEKDYKYLNRKHL